MPNPAPDVTRLNATDLYLLKYNDTIDTTANPKPEINLKNRLLVFSESNNIYRCTRLFDISEVRTLFHFTRRQQEYM